MGFRIGSKPESVLFLGAGFAEMRGVIGFILLSLAFFFWFVKESGVDCWHK